MNKDLDVLSPDQYSHSLNSLIEEFDGFPVNDYSNILGFVFDEDENVVNTLYISELNKRFVFTTKNRIIELIPKGYDDSKYNFEDVPLEYNNSEGVYTAKILVQSDCFNWKITNNLDVQYKITNSTLNFYFADGDNEDKYLYFNIDKNTGDLSIEDSFKEIISYDVYNNPIYGNNLDCNTIKWYPEVSYPDIKLKETEGGELLSGVYQFAIAPATSKGVQLAQYKGTTNPFHLANKTNTDITNYNTGLAIEVNISGFSEIGRYRFINLLVIKTINGVTTYEQIATLPISSNVRYLYTGNETQGIALDETIVFQIFPFYKSSKRLTKANNVLFKQGLKEYEKYNLQPIMHLFKLKWYTVSAKLGAYKSPKIASNYRSYLRDEVYIFGIKFILDNGEETPVYQLYGRNITLDDQIVVANADNITAKDECKEFTLPKKWQVYNTAYVTKTNSINIKDCEGLKQFEEGEFGYWASSELYPNDPNVWGENAGKAIRGFKFPDCSISSHFSNLDGNIIIHPIGVKLSDDIDVNNVLQEAVNQGYISQEQKDRIRGYKIIRGNRVGNESIKGKGLLFNTYNYVENNKLVTYANYPYNDLRRDPYLNNQDLKNQSQDWYKADMHSAEFEENNKYVFHSPETHYTSPVLGNILKAELDLSGESVGFFSKSKYQGEYVILSQLHYNFAILIAWLMTERLELEKAQPGEQGASIGGTIGTVAGGIIGTIAGGQTALGAVAGGALGTIVGKLIGGHTADNEYNATYRLSMWLSQAERIIELLKNTMTPENYHWQHQSIGKYTNFKPIPNEGKKLRKIETSAYLDSTRQILEDNTYFNNNLRESSVYFKLNQSIGTPSIQDNSRVRISDIDCDIEENEEVRRNISALYVSNKSNILNQYGNVFAIEWIPTSGKVWKLNEKFKEFGGDVFIGAEGFKTKMSFFTNTTYRLPDGNDIYYEDLQNIAYPKFFFNTRYTELSNPEEIDLKLLSAFNSLYVTVAINNLESPEAVTNNLDTDPSGGQTQKTMEAIANIFKRSIMNPYTLIRPGRYSVDCDKNDFFTKPIPIIGEGGIPSNSEDFIQIVSSGNGGANQSALNLLRDKIPLAGQRLIPNISLKFTGVKGKIYTYIYGIPYYVTESKINLDLRHATDAKQGNFYPNITDLNVWLQPDGGVEHPINYPNTYNYNRTFSKQNKEDLSLVNDINFFKDKDNIYHPNRVIYSRQGAEIENPLYRDNYLYFNPIDSGESSLEDGKIISIDAIESEQILIRMENNMKIANALNIIPTSGAVDSTLGSGSIFNSRPLQFSKADGGYFGTQHTQMLNTPYGHIFIDAKRGNVYNLQNGGKGVEELTKNGMKNWFETHLPFHLSKHFPTINIDNVYNGVGIAMSYDDRYKRFFITKLDAIPKIAGITYSDNKFWYDGLEISMYDAKYFCNASWTISYSFYTQSWRSFHSFIPNFYLDENKIFFSGLNGNKKGLSSIWVHNITNKSFQTYYGKLRPFEVESITKYSLTPQVLMSLGFKLDVIRAHNKNDKAYIDNISFNKAIISNDRQNSGLLHLDIVDKEDLFKIRTYPIKEEDSTRLLLYKNETEHNFNQFEDVSDSNSSLPIFINSCNGCDQALNKKSLKYDNLKVDNNYIRGDKVRVKLINDKTSKYKFIFKGLINNFTPSIV